jgi:L,D-transpeptidase YcbB
MRFCAHRQFLAPALLMLLAPSAAEAQVPPAPAATVEASALPTDLGVEALYATRDGAPFWLKDEPGRTAAAKIAALLRTASVDGLANNLALADAVEAALKGGTPADDKIISGAWVSYVRALSSPVTEVGYGDPLRQPKSPTAVAVLHDAAVAPALGDYVDRVSAVNPRYASLREAALNNAAADNPQVRATLQRLRLIPAIGRAILVDIASAQLFMLEDGRAVDSMKVVVGKSNSPTPELAGTIHYLTFNPYWHILDEVVQRKVAPVVLKRGVSYLKAARYETVSDWTESTPVDPATIDWKAVASGAEQAFIRQRPGANNMMGAVKFSFENDQDIFLHDTPHKELFAKARRNFSLGCVRLERADALTKWLLRGEPPPSANEAEHHLQLAEGVPVYLLNLTATVQDGALAFADQMPISGRAKEPGRAAAGSDAIAH